VSPAQLERAGKDPQPTPANAPSAAAGGGAITPLGGIAGGSVIVALLGSGAWFELRSRRRAVMPGRPA
jgi:hypothetical protein